MESQRNVAYRPSKKK